MPSISKKGQHMPQSPIRKLTPFAEQAVREGRHVYHLNIGQPDIETPENVLDAIKHIDFKIWGYTESEGTQTYRDKLATYYQSVGYDINADDIIVTTGGSEAINITFMTCLDAGDEVIVPEPFYANYNGFASQNDVVIRPVLSYIENGFALPPISAFEKAITARTKAIFICSPNNPTGYVYSRTEMEALKALVLKHDLYLFADEAYREFCYGDQEFVSPMHLTGLEDHAIIIDTVSKRYSACGARLGCMLTKNKQVWQTALKFAQARLSAGMVEQIAGTAAIDTPEGYFVKVKAEYNARRDVLVNALNRMDGVFCPNPGGAFYVMPSLPIDDADKFCRWMLEEFNHENQTVMMAPGSGFYSTPGVGKNEVRMAYVINVDDLKAAMQCLEIALKEYPGRVVDDEQLAMNR